MLMRGNIELNSLQSYADSLKEVLKQTMLSQEIMFRKQVCELHRLYSIQKMLMEDLDLTKLGKFDFLKASKALPSMVFDNSFKKKVNPQFGNIDSLERNQGICSNHPRICLDLWLPADQYIAYVGTEFPNKEDPFPKIKHSPVDEFIPDQDELKLSLSIGEDAGSRGSTKESMRKISNDDEKPSSPFSFFAPHNCPGSEIGLQVYVPSNPAISKTVQRDPAHRIAASSSDVDGSGSYQKQIFSNQDTGPEYMFTMKRQYALCKASEMDFNRVYLDDLACSPKDSMVGHHSSDAASNVSDEPVAKTSTIEKGEEPAVYSSSASCKQVMVQDKPDYLVDNNYSGMNTGHSGTEIGSSNFSDCNDVRKTHLIFEVSETNSSTHDQQLTDDSDLNHGPYNKNKEEPAEMDDLIQRAAESLVSISLETPASYRDCSSKEGSHQLETEEIQPENSSDSYASITLRLTESNGDDDYCALSKSFEVNERGDDFGSKFRRGRRLKDFRKDILPGLASLSRHEICEDINIFKGVMRSREYRKIQSRMANNVESWCMPVRSKRSRINNIRRGSCK